MNQIPVEEQDLLIPFYLSVLSNPPKISPGMFFTLGRHTLSHVSILEKNLQPHLYLIVYIVHMYVPMYLCSFKTSVRKCTIAWDQC